MWVTSNWIGSEDSKSRLWACITADRGSGWWAALIFADEIENNRVRTTRGFVNSGIKIKLRTCTNFTEAFVCSENGMTFWVEQPSKDLKEAYDDCVQRHRIRQERLCPDCMIGQREPFQDVCTECL